MSNNENAVLINIQEDSVLKTSEIKSNPKLSFVDGVAILVGIIIGSGIFSSPGLALERSGSSGAVLIAWSVSGFLVIMATQCYIELGSMMPTAGGDFDYLKRAYGDRAAFSFAWYNFFVSKTGSQAIIATIFGRYFEAVITADTNSIRNSASSEETLTSKLSAICLITLLTLLNCFGIKESAIVQIILTSSKILLISIIFVFSIVFISKDSATLKENLSPSSSFDGSNSFINFGSSMVACLWCFDGFADVNYLQEDLIDPIKNLPKIVRFGLIIVTISYLLMNIAYLSVLEKNVFINSKAIAVEFGNIVGSKIFEKNKTILSLCLAFGVVLSTAGAANGSIMTGGRALYAVARDGKAPGFLSKKTHGTNVPYTALLAQGCWTIVLLLLPGSSFSSLLDYFGPTSWIFYAFTASALIRLRFVEPLAARPFKVPFYPLPPLLVMFIALIILISSLTVQPLFTFLAIGFVSLSLPFHYFFMEQKFESNQYQRVISSLYVLSSSRNILLQQQQQEEEGEEEEEEDNIKQRIKTRSKQQHERLPSNEKFDDFEVISLSDDYG